MALDSGDRRIFSLSAGKQDLYIYPIAPAIVALAAVVITGARGITVR